MNYKSPIINWFFVFLWAGLIFFLSSMPNLESGLDQDFLLRKFAHIFEYFVLTLLIFQTVFKSKQNKKTALFLAAVSSLLYAISDEYHQTFVFGRSGNVTDVIIDSFGIFLAVLLILVLWKSFGKIFLPKT